ncbi:MAG: hypothetical protein ACI8W8_002904, partial [Rhodothermales bacterium]
AEPGEGCCLMVKFANAQGRLKSVPLPFRTHLLLTEVPDLS